MYIFYLAQLTLETEFTLLFVNPSGTLFKEFTEFLQNLRLYFLPNYFYFYC